MPPRTPGTQGNLPAELTQFVGRGREIDEIRQLLPESRLVTLTGIGGVGKTRLAIKVAEEVQRAFDDGVWLVEFGKVREPELIAGTVVSALKLPGQLTRSPLEPLIEFVTTRHLLLVFDNCEHLVDAIASLAESLLRAAPRLRILATSREPVGIGGEVVIPVSPLAIPGDERSPSLRAMLRCDAVALFVDRARSAVPGFELTEDSKVTVARICRRLEGLPLPIELTAARLRAMSPEQILQRLTDRYRLLTGGGRAVPSRQQTLRQCIDWSYDLLTDRERELWARATVFAGGFELDAAEAICGEGLDPGDVLDLVGSLVDKSVLVREACGDVVRYRMLETVREYGLERLHGIGGDTTMRRRHRNWFERLALRAYSGWVGPNQLEWIERLNREQSNLRAALEFCLDESGEVGSAERIAVALYEYWIARQRFSEARYWFGRTLERSSGATLEHLAALCADTLLAAMQADFTSGAERLEQARLLAEGSGEELFGAYVDGASGFLSLFSGDFAGAVTHLEHAVPVFESSGDVLHHVSSLLGLGAACGLLQESDRATACRKQALALTRERGESIYRSYAISQLAYETVERGDLERGAVLVKESLRLAQMLDDRKVVAADLASLALVAAEQRQAERAAVLVGATVSVGESAGGQAATIVELFGHHTRAKKYAARALGQRTYAAMVRRGQDLDIDEAIAYALEEQASAQQHGTVAMAVLTRREKQIAELIAEGLTNRAIAEKLVISPRTAAGHVEHILSKLHFTTRAQVAAWVVGQQ
ncbi:LuxR family transcriptional regulator [Nocardia cyriacigeorgica]|uniref:ATP-binding protein n=1 Tax=Nocardia cyriacigeorgica TaxID=135487 RepID=UPI0013BD8DE0|nr:LuxR C-terminal-related transcriptional regulator [Nocardia cyriacigeorgica]NEW42231.1 LuxR family transcriptional regulator [Nocardia cyriacigeorgica]NEW51295.1 LuxR family transcriptional regulator [Nocardia cyriacigeorgica]